MSQSTTSPEAQLRGFIARFDPEVASRAQGVRAWLRRLMPSAVEFVYDKANNLVIGFGPNERPSDAIFSIIVWPKWVTLCFLQGAILPDPHRVLKGEGNVVRSVRLTDVADLEKPELRALIDLALARADVPMPAKGKSYTLIRQVSANPRRPRSGARPGGRGAARPRR